MTAGDIGLRPESGGDERYRSLSAWADGRQVATVAMGLKSECVVAIAPELPGLRRQEMTDLLEAIAELARREGRTEVVLTNADLLLRHQARDVGFRGPLRQNLRFDLNGTTAGANQQPVTDHPDPAGTFVSDLQMLLPDLEVHASRPPGLLRSALRSASSGVAGTIHLTAEAPDRIEPLRVAVPVAADIMAEPIALAMDTAVSVRRRFRPLADRVRLFYDQSQRGLRTGKWAGVAQPGVAEIHISSSWALAGELEALLETLIDRQRERPSTQNPVKVPPPFTRIDGIIAHEYWHQIEAGFKSRRYRDSIQFRLTLGRYFGVETIEHAIRGRASDAPAAWQEANRRLAEEVSGYATTTADEATAEMFELWWCTTDDPTPIVRCFDSLLVRFLPAP